MAQARKVTDAELAWFRERDRRSQEKQAAKRRQEEEVVCLQKYTALVKN